MAINYGHGWELLYKAISGMVVGNGDVKKRLGNAFIELSGLREDELPAKTWRKFHSLYVEATAVPAIGDEGKIVASINKMTDARAKEIASDVFDIFMEQSRMYYAHK
jgi:hypothetical protein